MSISESVRRRLAATRAVAAAAVLLGAAAPALALQPPPVDLGTGHVWLGLGFLRYQRPYVGNSRWSRFLPLVNIDTPHFYVHGTTFGWRAWRRGGSTFELVARPDALHYNGADNGALAGMTTKLSTVMGGAAWVWRFHDHLALHTDALTDLLRRNDGDILSVALAGRWRAGKWFFQPRASVEWLSSNYVDYYFGVTPAEARPGRPAYTGTATADETIGLNVGRRFSGHFAAVAGAWETHYGSGVTASPIVAKKDAVSLIVGLYYHF